MSEVTMMKVSLSKIWNRLVAAMMVCVFVPFVLAQGTTRYVY
jgi:hypothetical protein